MRVVHLIGGGDEGGAKSHVLSLVEALGASIEVSLLSFRKGPFHDDAVKMGIDAHCIHARSLVTEVRRALVVLRRSPCDLMHAHGAKGNLIGLILRRITGIPLVTTVHSDYRLDYMHSLSKRLTYGIVNTVALRLIHHHVAVSENFRSMLTDRGFDPQHIQPVYNGIPFNNEIPVCTREDFFRRYAVPFPAECLLVGIMARLHPVKDHETFLRAAARLAEKHPNVRFLCGGPGEMKPQLEKLTDQLGIRDKVHFAGMVANPYDFFQVIDINVLTSLSESFPYVILEGARFSKPTISSRVGGLGDLFRSGENGFLFEPRDVDTLYTHLDALCGSETLRQEMGSRLEADARARFSLESMCRTQLSIYRNILAYETRSAQDGKRCDIALLGYYGYRNSGDEAILKSLTASVRAVRPDITFTVLSRDPAGTRSAMKVATVHRFNLLRTISAIRRSRLFIAGGGSLIQDNTSTRSIFYYLGMLTIARLCGAKTMLLGNGLGPIIRPSNRRWASKVLNRLDAITLRDPESKLESDRLGITAPRIEVTADPAWLLHHASGEDATRCLQTAGIPTDCPLVAFSIRKWTDAEETLHGMAALADHCVKNLHATPVFVPMQHPDDLALSRRILSCMEEKGYVLSEPYPPDMLMAIIGRFELVLGMRLHSLIYAAGLCVPMAGIVYEPKVSAFLHEAGQPVLCRIGEGDTAAWPARLDAVWAQRKQLEEVLRNRSAGFHQAAGRNVAITLSLLP